MQTEINIGRTWKQELYEMTTDRRAWHGSADVYAIGIKDKRRRKLQKVRRNNLLNNKIMLIVFSCRRLNFTSFHV